MKMKNKRKMHEELRFEELLQVAYYTVENIRLDFLVKRENLLEFLVEKRKKENKSNMLFFVHEFDRYGQRTETWTDIYVK